MRLPANANWDYDQGEFIQSHFDQVVNVQTLLLLWDAADAGSGRNACRSCNGPDEYLEAPDPGCGDQGVSRRFAYAARSVPAGEQSHHDAGAANRYRLQTNRHANGQRRSMPRPDPRREG